MTLKFFCSTCRQAIIAAVLIVLFIGCNEPAPLKSSWINNSITVDGSQKDWSDMTIYFDEESNSRIGFANDGQWLYICLWTRNASMQQQILGEGFTTWICQDKVKNKLWGIRYSLDGGVPPGDDRVNKGGWPVGSPEGGGEAGTKPTTFGADDPVSMGAINAPPEREGDLLSSSQAHIELLVQGEKSGKMMTTSEMETMGVACRVGSIQGGGVVYEARIPLDTGNQVAISAPVNEKGEVLLGFLSEMSGARGVGGGAMDGGGGRGGGMEGDSRGGGMIGGFVDGDMMGGGNMGGGGMGRGGMDGGGPGVDGRGGSPESSFELWALVKLAGSLDKR